MVAINAMKKYFLKKGRSAFLGKIYKDLSRKMIFEQEQKCFEELSGINLPSREHRPEGTASSQGLLGAALK